MACLLFFDSSLVHPMDQCSTASSCSRRCLAAHALPALAQQGFCAPRLCLVTHSTGLTPTVTHPPFSYLNKWFYYRYKHNYKYIFSHTHTFAWGRKPAGLISPLMEVCFLQSIHSHRHTQVKEDQAYPSLVSSFG